MPDAEKDAGRRCDVVATSRPIVWKDDHGWNCDQATECRTCKAVSFDRLAEGAPWAQAVSASREARVFPPGGGTDGE